MPLAQSVEGAPYAHEDAPQPAESEAHDDDRFSYSTAADLEIVQPTEDPPLVMQEAEPASAPPAEERAPAPPPPAASEHADEPNHERAVQYNVPPPHEVSGPAPTPRRGWWRR
jgi:hypothetical protein